MKTLVTGATGFIGNHLIRELLGEKRNVRCLVRKSSNRAVLREFEKLGVETVSGDLLDKASLQRAVRGVKIAYHVAGEVYSVSRDSTYYKVNVRGTENLVEACLTENIRKFIYLSSIAAVGPNRDRNILLKEADECHPIVPYGKSKYEAEKILLTYYREKDFPVVIVRPPIVYGPRQKSELTNVFRAIKKGKFMIVGAGDNLKSLCYIDNLIQGMVLAEKKGKSGEIYFIADEKPYSINELCSTISRLEGKEVSYTHLPTFIADLSGFLFNVIHRLFKFSFLPLFTIKTVKLDFACDISKAGKELGYVPQINLEEGLKRTLAWHNAEEEKHSNE